MVTIDFNKRHKEKKVRENTVSQIIKNSTQVLEVGDNLKELKREDRARVSKA